MASVGIRSGVGGSPLNTGDTQTVFYPTGYTTSSFAGTGYVRAGGANYTVTFTLGASSASFVWTGPTLASGTPIFVNLDLNPSATASSSNPLSGMATDAVAQALASSAYALASTAPKSNPVPTNLRRAISNKAKRRHEETPWVAVTAYAANTLYAAGQWASNGGNLYVANVGGTSGAASAPTGTGLGPITDGTVSWLYMGAAYSSDPQAPSWSVSTSAPGLGRFYRNATGTFSSGAATVISNDGWYEYTGSNSAPGSAGFSSFVSGAHASRLSFMTDDLTVVIAQTNASGSYGPTIEIDGRYLTAGRLPQAGTSGTTYTTITFPDKRVRRVTVRWAAHSVGTSIRGVYTSATGTVWAPPLRDGAIRMYYMGDSFSINTNAGDALDYGIAFTASDLLGVDDLYIDGFGGTGYTAGGANVYTSAARLANLAAYAPNVVIFQGSVNDAAASQSAITTAMTTLLSSVRTPLGANPLVIFTGFMSRATGEATVEGYIRTAAAALAASDPNVLFVPASGDAGGAWGQGTGTISTPTGVGNGDAYWSADDLHPIGRGYGYLGNRLGRAIMKLVP